MLQDTCPRIAEVPGAQLKLWDHQLAMLKKAMVIESSIFGANMTSPYGVFSDPPGSGKSNVVLSLILMDKYMERIADKHFGGKSVKKLTGTNLLVVPHNIHTQWVEAIRTFAGPSLTFKTFVDYADISALYFGGHDVFQYDLLVTTPLYYDVIASTIRSLNFSIRRVFFDEIDTIKLSIKHMIPANVTWFISASVSRLFNEDGTFMVNKMYDGAIEEDIAQEAYAISLKTLLAHEVKCSEAFIGKSIQLLKPEEAQIKCPNIYIDSIFANILPPEKLLAINACDYSCIRDPAFPCNIRDDRDALIVYTKNVLHTIEECNKKISALDDFIVKKQTCQVKEVVDMVAVVRKEIRDLETEKKKHTVTLRKGYMLMNNNDICNNCALECKSMSSKDCPCLRCPKCQDLPCSACVSTDLDLSAARIDRPKILKIQQLLSKLLENPDAKILVFSSHTSIFTEIINHLAASKTVSSELDGGNVSSIDKCIRGYKEGDTSVMLVHSMLFGSGSNLENTTDVIFVHRMEASLSAQVIGRAQRPGRTGRLKVWYMCHNNELA